MTGCNWRRAAESCACVECGEARETADLVETELREQLCDLQLALRTVRRRVLEVFGGEFRGTDTLEGAFIAELDRDAREAARR